MFLQFFVHRQLDRLLVRQSVRCVDSIALLVSKKAVVAICIGWPDEVGVLAVVTGNIAFGIFLDEGVGLEEASIGLVATLANSIFIHVF